MTDTRSNISSVVERARPVKADAGIVGVHFLKDTAVFVLSEESLHLVPRGGDAHNIKVHDGAILDAVCDGKRIITGGDDGKVAAFAGRGEPEVIATDAKRRWIDHVAAGPDGAVAWSAGKEAFARTGKSDARMVEVASTVGALAFAPKGVRLAIAHYNGASLWFPNAKAAPERYEWKGSHLAASFSPDGRFLVTAMQEPQLHAWRVTDRKDMRMSGYTARVRSLGWTHDGKTLATSGSTQLILWPFQSKDGPMGKTPQLMAPTQSQVEVVACHPKQAICAVGYADGMVLLVRTNDGAEILARRPGEAAITALAWNAMGTLVAFGAEDGEAGVIDLA